MRKVLKIIIVNFLVFFFLFILVEIIFGYWFKEYNFGHQMRGKRMQKIVFEHSDGSISNFYRDYYGFVEDRDFFEKYDASKIEVLFNGGSTAEEMLLNYDETIVGKINSYLKNDKINLKIYNAGVSGKSLKGKIREFSIWFKNIQNFKPKIIIYYLGINDRSIDKYRWHDFDIRLNFLNEIYWNISQKSFFYEKGKLIKNKYFPHTAYQNQYNTSDEVLIKRLNNNEFISYDYAKNNYKIENENESQVIETFKVNLNKLKKELINWNINPIFITQINFNINGDKILYLLNEETKKFAQENNYKVIKLDELVTDSLNNSFIDGYHTNNKGSEEIAKILYKTI
jgi:lysophospholipase L1-like esterase